MFFFSAGELDSLHTRSRDEWAAIEERAKASGLTLQYNKADITDGEGINTLFETISREAPAPVRVLIHCAASRW